tara:strand:+ start:81 stop:578 length:498 start_codon:yes stop_codon:yes gene_type:complete
MKIRFTILILLALGLTGCDCYVKVEGQILSSSTGKPISNAQITMVDQDRIVMTDENGQFMIDKVTGFCFDPEIEVAKDGFKPFLITVSVDSDAKIYQVKSDPKPIDFDKPIYPDPEDKHTYITSTWIDQYSQNFESKNDSLIIYLDKKDMKGEIKSLKEKIKNGG